MTRISSLERYGAIFSAACLLAALGGCFSCGEPVEPAEGDLEGDPYDASVADTARADAGTVDTSAFDVTAFDVSAIDVSAIDVSAFDASAADAGGADAFTDAGSADACDFTCDIHPQCWQRGGSCTLVDYFGDPCPAGSYNPFSGGMAQCPTGAIRLCCVSNGGGWAPCDDGNQCDSTSCLSEASGYPTGGFCPSGICEPGLDQCADWEVCLPVMFSAAMGMCMLTCDSDELCREGWSCQAFPRQPFSADDHETAYVCWEPAAMQGGLGLGEACGQDSDCLSGYCLADPGDAEDRCTATCDDAAPCLAGYGCEPIAGCTTTGCGACFPS